MVTGEGAWSHCLKIGERVTVTSVQARLGGLVDPHAYGVVLEAGERFPHDTHQTIPEYQLGFPEPTKDEVEQAIESIKRSMN